MPFCLVRYTHEHNILNQQKPAFLAVALATIVLPHPGGPYNKTPKTVQNTFNKTFFISIQYILFYNFLFSSPFGAESK